MLIPWRVIINPSFLFFKTAVRPTISIKQIHIDVDIYLQLMGIFSHGPPFFSSAGFWVSSRSLEILGITGIEDKLQEWLRKAGRLDPLEAVEQPGEKKSVTGWCRRCHR